VDETATGSANLFGPSFSTIAAVHFHPPSIAPGVTALVWAVLLGAYIYFGLVAVGAAGAFAYIVAALSAAGIWLLVRVRGSER
jgi:hypothetical protein